MAEEIYVLVCERDTYTPEEGGRPIVFEQYIDRGHATLDAIKAFQKRLGDKYGKTMIARLDFIDVEQMNSVGLQINPDQFSQAGKKVSHRPCAN